VKLSVLTTALLMVCTSAVAQEPGTPDVATLLFETPQWAAAPAGTRLTYRYARKSSSEPLFGPSFEDRIGLRLDKGDGLDDRTVAVELFSGERRRAAGPFESVTSNPVLMLFLEQHVQQLSQLLRANPRYLKNAIRAAWRDRAEIAKTDVVVDGRRLSGTRIVIRPFLDDPNKTRMNGLDTLTYAVTICAGVPGEIVAIDVDAQLGDGVPGLEERLVYGPKDE